MPRLSLIIATLFLAGCHSAGPPPPIPAMDHEVPVAQPGPEPAEGEEGSPLVGAVWCALTTRADSEQAPGCDAGLGLALYPWSIGRGRHVALVATLGEATVGVGVALTVGETRHLRVSVGLGLIAPWDSGGIYWREWAGAAGATAGMGEGR